MARCSRAIGSAAAVVAVAMGVPLIVTLFLGVLAHCYLEWVRDTLASRLSMPTRPMRTAEANP
jgi:hypothetical protein